jgi:pyridoxamine 5'-phosphate oxidase
MSDAFLGSRDTYDAGELNEEACGEDPLALLRKWVDDAVAAQVTEPTACAVATVGPEGRPSNRIVLLRKIDHGLVFFTNYDSRKGRELAHNPNAALTLFWPDLQRQVRAEGWAEPVLGSESDAYFASRPRESQLASAASPQSKEVSSRDELELLVEEAQRRYPGEVPRPAHWGGFRLDPDRIEFWQGRPGRLHDRIVFELEAEAWRKFRLAP